ncbi:hypothetical protein ABKN59_003859 [Abortiporus biennis]
MFAGALLALAAIASSAQAALFTTAPVGSTSWAAGQPQTITWQDDGSAPTLQQFGAAKVTIGVGNTISQTQLQLITASVDVSTTAAITFTPDPSVGPNGNFYFVRFESINLKDATTPQYPALAFSAKFALTGMTGTFNSTVQAQADGSSSAAATTSASAANNAAATTSATPTAGQAAVSKAATTGTSSHATSASATPTGAKSGATAVAFNGFAAALSGVAAVVVGAIAL